MNLRNAMKLKVGDRVRMKDSKGRKVDTPTLVVSYPGIYDSDSQYIRVVQTDVNELGYISIPRKLLVKV